MKRMFLLLIVIACFILLPKPAKAELSWLHTDGKNIKYENGSIAILHGVNLDVQGVSSETVFQQKYKTSAEETISSMKEAGVQIVRLSIDGYYWYNTGKYPNYVTLVDKIVSLSASNGIYVAIDLHQINGSWEPADKANLIMNNNVNPPETNQTFFLEFWKLMADRYKYQPHVLYSLFNEPQRGTYLKAAVAEGWYNLALSVSRAIHSINPKALIIMATLIDENKKILYFDEHPLPESNIVYAWHDYYGNDLYLEARRFEYALAYNESNLTVAREEFFSFLKNATLFMLDKNLPIIMEEFGATSNRSGMAVLNGEIEIQDRYSIYNDYNLSWMQWTWKRVTQTDQGYGFLQDDGKNLTLFGKILKANLFGKVTKEPRLTYSNFTKISESISESVGRKDLKIVLSGEGHSLVIVKSPEKPNKISLNSTLIPYSERLDSIPSWNYNPIGRVLYIVLEEKGATPVTMPLTLHRYTSLLKDANAASTAELFDMSQSWNFTGELIQQIHQIKPDYKALFYRSTKIINKNWGDEWNLAIENNWLLKNVSGQFINLTTWPNNYLVDFGNSSYQKWVAAKIKSEIDKWGFDGVYADVSLNAYVDQTFWDAGSKPINPRTGTYWTDDEVRQATIQLHKEIKQAIGSKLLVCNGIYTGSRFYKHYDAFTEVLQGSPLDGFMGEGTWYTENGVWLTENEWKQSLDFVIWTQDNFLKDHSNRMFIPMCKLEWNAGEFPIPPDSTKEQMVKYAFTSTLLGAKTSQNYLGYILMTSLTEDFIRQTIKPLHDIDVGEPLNDYYMIEGTHVYTRDFSKVKVLVNPTDSAYTVTLDGNYKTLSGETVTAVTMTNHTGEILLGL